MTSFPAAFKAGTLYALCDAGALLLQVCSDFDVAQRTLDKSILGKGKRYSQFGPMPDAISGDLDAARIWNVESQKQYDYAFETFFAAYTPPNEVRNKPVINKLLLVPISLDRPILPNDLGDKR